MDDIHLNIDADGGRIELVSKSGVKHFSGFHVTQSKKGTLVYRPECHLTKTKYKEYSLPSPRYSLEHDRPASGAAGRQEFEKDFLEFLIGQGMFAGLVPS